MAHMGTCLTVIDLDGKSHVVTRSGLFYAYGGKSDGLPLTLFHDAARINDFGGGLKRPGEIMARVRNMGYCYEHRYDAAHGRRYKLGVWGGKEFSKQREIERRVVIAAMDGISNLKEYHEQRN